MKNTYQEVITLTHVAELAGVSTAAVSVVMREEMGYPVKSGRMKFSKETRDKILRAIRETGYKPNIFSRALVSGRSSLIGYIQQAELSIFKYEYTIGVEDVAASKHYGTLMATIHDNTNMEEFNPIDLMLEKRVDGIILLCDTNKLMMQDLKKIEAMSVPLVYLAYIPKTKAKNSGSVCVNGKTIGSIAISHLLELGHMQIACVNTTEWIREGIELATHSSNACIDYWSFDKNTTHPMKEIFIRWMNMTNRPTAIYVNGDHLAVSLMNLLFAAGIKIPEDVSIISNDGIQLGQNSIVPLTTVNQPKYEQGMESANLLFSLIQGEKPRDIILEPQIEIRQSTSRPKLQNS